MSADKGLLPRLFRALNVHCNSSHRKPAAAYLAIVANFLVQKDKRTLTSRGKEPVKGKIYIMVL